MIVQFTISIALMVGTAIVYQQMNFIFTANLGYQRDQVITLSQNGQAFQNSQTFRTELLRNPSVVSVGTASSRIGQQIGRTTIRPEGFSTDVNIITSAMNIDEEFIPTMGMEMKAGRNFSLQFKDSLNLIINEELVRLLKWDDAVGKTISLGTGPGPNDYSPFTIVGVVKDFHFATIRHKLEPLFMRYNPNNGSMAIKVKQEGMESTIEYIEATWKKVNAGATFEYAFLDDQFATLYRNEKAFSNMFTHFTVLAMIIAGLGLFALSAFTAEQRKKEIGIRKVMGASTTSILLKLVGEFIPMIVIAFAAACVVGYYLMQRWLEDFQYSVPIGAGVFVLSGLAAMAIAVLTVSFQALRAANTNPVNTLRTE